MSAIRNKFAALDSDDEETPVVKQVPTKTEKKHTPITARQNEKEKEKKNVRSARGGRGGSRGRGSRGPKRDHDRRSGTGHGREGVKHGSGAHNWGNEASQVELAAEAAVAENGPSDEEAATDAPAEEEEEEDNEMTLDEYLEKRKQERSGELFAETSVRQVENEFDAQALITKDGKTPDFMEAHFEKVLRERKSGRKKNVVTDVGFRAPPTFNDRRNNYQSNGGRRGGRGGRGRGRGRHAPNVADLKSFPTLG